jgi:aconitate hydratase
MLLIQLSMIRTSPAVIGDNFAQGGTCFSTKISRSKFAIFNLTLIGWQNLINFGIVPFEFKNP